MKKLTLLKIARAVLIGAVLFWLLSFLQGYLVMRTLALPQQQAIEDDEPVHYDKSGKRINQPDFEILSGYEAAKQGRLATHAACAAAFEHLVRMGCQKYVTEQKVFPPKISQGNWDSGKTTAQCVAEVNAHWAPRIADEQEKGGGQAAASWTRRSWGPDLQECQNYDNMRIATVIHAPASRLDAILARLDGGAKVSAADRATVLADMPGVSAFPDNPDRTAYLGKAERFYRVADGSEPRFIERPLQLSCEAIRAELDTLKQAEQGDVDAQAALRQGDVIRNGAQWDALNKSRLDRQWSVKRFMDAAAAAKCPP